VLTNVDAPVTSTASPTELLQALQLSGYCRLRFGWFWGSMEMASHGGRNETTFGEPVSHSALTTQGILTKCVLGLTFKGSTIYERCSWRWTPTTNQDVNDSTAQTEQAIVVTGSRH
jgi:hypothetical protein